MLSVNLGMVKPRHCAERILLKYVITRTHWEKALKVEMQKMGGWCAHCISNSFYAFVCLFFRVRIARVLISSGVKSIIMAVVQHFLIMTVQ